MSAKGCGGQISHLLGSLLAATFVSPRLRFGVVRSRSRFSQILKILRFRSRNKIDSEGCLPAKGCGVVQHLLYQACRPHPLSVSQAPNLLQKAQIMVFMVVYQKEFRIFAAH